uniref:Uncharacterized protein n=1 Tax=Steinernema glaseri TaxID=37863 RepID=A0A1I7Y408_9BILA
MQYSSKSEKPGQWGDYYLSAGGRRNGKSKMSWYLEFIHQANQVIPTFNETFDQESFYMFAIFVVAASVVAAFVLARCFKIRIKEHDIHVDREWRKPRLAHPTPFRFPWTKPEKEHQH